MAKVMLLLSHYANAPMFPLTCRNLRVDRSGKLLFFFCNLLFLCWKHVKD